MHEAEQPERAQGDGLAARVRAGHHERRVAVADADVDRHDPSGQPRVARREQHDLGPIRGLGPGGVHVGRQAGLGRPQVEPGQALERLAQRSGIGGDERRQLVEDPGDLLLLGHLGLPPGVAQLDGDERLDEQRLPAARGVVDDALHPGPGLGLDRDHVAAVAQRDDRLLEGAAELRAHERVEPSPQPVVCDADGGPQPAQPWRRGVEQLADRVEAARQGAAHRRQRMEAATQLAQQRTTLLGEGRREARRGIQRVGDRQELLRVEAASAGRPFDGRADVVRPADSDARVVAQQRACLVGLVEHARHHRRIGLRLQRLGQTP